MNKIRFLALTVVLGVVGSVGTPETRAGGRMELNIQGSSTMGGSATVIRGQKNRAIPFSVTGRYNDLLVVYLPDGNWVVIELRELFEGPYTRVRPNTKLPDGQTRGFFEFARNPALNGALLVLYSGSSGDALDWDFVELR